jgi:diguanylate cyclase (GGDEF)-like protein
MLGIGLLAAALAWAEPITLDWRFEAQWRHFDADSGLPQNSVTAILLDADGYLWVGTFGGLARHDGLEFRHYAASASDGPPSDRITALYRDSEDRIWIGTENAGVGRYDPRQGFARSPRGCEPHCQVVHFVGLIDGLMLVGGDDGLFWVDERLESQSADPGTLARRPHTAALSAPGLLWWASYDAYLAPGLASPRALPEGEVIHRLHTFQGQVLAAGERLWRLSPTQPPTLAFSGEVPARVMTAFETPDGGLVLGGLRGGLARVAPGTQRAEPLNTPSSGLSPRMLVDPQGTLWLGSDGGGLHRRAQAQAGALGGPGTALAAAVMAVEIDAGQRLWIGTFCDGLFVHEPPGILKPIELPQVDSGCIWSLASDSAGTVWVSADSARLIQLRSSGEPLRSFVLENETRLRALHVDPQGRVWAGGTQGLYHLVDDRLFERVPGFPQVEVSTVLDARDGGLWVGSDEGVLHWRDGRVERRLGLAEGLGSRFVRGLLEDETGVLWIGTYGGGLHRFDGRSLRRFGREDGLFEEFVSCVAQDPRGRLWLSGNRGITRLDKRALDGPSEHGVAAILFTRNDGLPVSESNGGGSARCTTTQAGRLVFPMISGVGAIDPAMTLDPAASRGPPVDLLELRVNGKLWPDGRPLDFDAGPVTLALRYTAPSLVGGERVRFRYRLLSQTWSEVGTAREILISELPYGRHQIEIAARIDSGDWSAEPLRIAFQRAPPWHLDWRVQGAAVLGLMLAIWGLVQARTRALRHRAARLDALVAERTRQLVAANQRLDQLARRDPLTGLANRRLFDERLAQDFAAAAKRGDLLALIVFDVDRFKAYNDSHGHPAGDRCLQRVAEAASRVVAQALAEAAQQPEDALLARIGGEEFALLLRDRLALAADRIAEALRRELHAQAIAHAGAPGGVVTISLGVAVQAPRAEGSALDLLSAADAALYEAKRGGRNRVALASTV